MSVTISSKDRFQKALTYCSQYITVYNAMVPNTAPDDTNAGYQNTMLKALVDGGYWTNRMDAFYVLANNNSANAFINWVNPGTFDITDPDTTNPAFVAYEGFTGDGGSDYLSTNYNPFSDYTNYLLDSATIGAYCRTADIAGAYCAVGARSASTAITRLYIRNVAATYYFTGYVNDDAPIQVANSTSQGLAIMTRRASNDVQAYMNGSSIGTSASVSNSIPNQDLAILANYTAGTGPTLFFPGQLSIVFVMNGISTGDASAINTIIETYMDAIGKGVQA